jgi:hypothetical protein
MDRLILKGLLIFGLVALPISLRKPPIKDWLLVFFIKAFISSYLGKIVVGKKMIAYPIRFHSKLFKISIIYDYLLFPLTCMWYNQVTFRSTIQGIFWKSFLFSIPMTLLEAVLERKTDLVKYKKWSPLHTFTSLTATFLGVRLLMEVIRRISKKQKEEIYF